VLRKTIQDIQEDPVVKIIGSSKSAGVQPLAEPEQPVPMPSFHEDLVQAVWRDAEFQASLHELVRATVAKKSADDSAALDRDRRPPPAVSDTSIEPLVLDPGQRNGDYNAEPLPGPPRLPGQPTSPEPA